MSAKHRGLEVQGQTECIMLDPAANMAAMTTRTPTSVANLWIPAFSSFLFIYICRDIQTKRTGHYDDIAAYDLDSLYCIGLHYNQIHKSFCNIYI